MLVTVWFAVAVRVTIVLGTTAVALAARVTDQATLGSSGAASGAAAWAAGRFADGSSGAAAAPATPAVAIVNAPRIESSSRPERVN